MALLRPLLLALTLLIFPIHLAGQELLLLFREPGRAVMLDTTSIRRVSPSQYSAYVMIRYDPPRAFRPMSPGPRRPVQLSKALTLFDCQRRVVVVTLFTTYGTDGGLIDSVETARGGTAPFGGNATILLGAVCSRGAGRRR